MNISRFSGADLITSNEREARISSCNHEVGFVVLAEQLHINSKPENILLKTGEEGLLKHDAYRNKESKSWLTDCVDSLNSALGCGCR